MSTSESEFDNALILFSEKLLTYNSEEINEFLEYFVKQWVYKNYKWFEGCAKYVPKTNNALESHNNEIKRNGTVRELLPFGEYLDAIYRFIKQTSENINIEKIFDYNIYSNILSSEWVKAVEFSELFKKAKITGKCVIIYDLAENKELPSYPESSTIKQFIYNKTKIVKLTRTSEKYECTCSFYLKKYYCYHSLGANILFFQKMPIYDVRNILFKKKNKRGKQKKVAKALIREESNI